MAQLTLPFFGGRVHVMGELMQMLVLIDWKHKPKGNVKQIGVLSKGVRSVRWILSLHQNTPAACSDDVVVTKANQLPYHRGLF